MERANKHEKKNGKGGDQTFFRKAEQKYLEKGNDIQDSTYPAHSSSPEEGFQRHFRLFGNSGTSFRPSKEYKLGRSSPVGKAVQMGSMMKIYKDITHGIKSCYNDIEPYFTKISNSSDYSYDPNLWNDLLHYTRNNWDIVKVGFTEIPQQLIFQGKFILFRYALIFMQEMNKNRIDTAPNPPAGQEAMRVYASLGLAVNDIARWLRKRGIRCQSNHPLGGLTLTPPLAGKAGMGWYGRQGVLITPEFGPRQRLAPIYVEHKLFEFTDNVEHKWIEKYCEKCGACARECPAEAIFEEKRPYIYNVLGLETIKKCIDADKCFPYFEANFGCSICIKICPFSEGKAAYDRLKKTIEN